MFKLSKAGLCMAGAHVALIAAAVALTLAGHERDWHIHWLIFLALDFPVSLGVMPLAWMFPPSVAGPLSDFPNFWWPLLFHGVVGTAWWYIVGWAIGRRLARFRAGGDTLARDEGTSAER